MQKEKGAPQAHRRTKEGLKWTAMRRNAPLDEIAVRAQKKKNLVMSVYEGR